MKHFQATLPATPQFQLLADVQAIFAQLHEILTLLGGSARVTTTQYAKSGESVPCLQTVHGSAQSIVLRFSVCVGPNTRVILQTSGSYDRVAGIFGSVAVSSLNAPQVFDFPDGGILSGELFYHSASSGKIFLDIEKIESTGVDASMYPQSSLSYY